MQTSKPYATNISFADEKEVLTETSATGKHRQDAIWDRDRLNAEATSRLKSAFSVTSVPCEAAYNQFMVSGQSWGCGQEGWPLLSDMTPAGVMMLGQSTRPAGYHGTIRPFSLGDEQIRPAIPVCQARDGNPITAEEQAVLAPRDPALGEDPVLVAAAFARWLWMRSTETETQLAERLFLVTNVAVCGRTAEEWEKGAPVETFNRLRVMAARALEAVSGLRKGLGVVALFDLHGESNFGALRGSSSDKETFKQIKRRFVEDFKTDVVQTVLQQKQMPAIITYQVSGAYTQDDKDLSIAVAQWELSQEVDNWFLATPSYPFPSKGAHLDPNGYRWMGCQLGKVFFETVIARRGWRPLSPMAATRRDRTVLVDFFVPCPPLQFQPVFIVNDRRMHKDKGFTLIDEEGVVILDNVDIVAPTIVQITAARPFNGTVAIYYGRQAVHKGTGNLCDSDPIETPYNYEYREGTGQYATANIPDLVGKPYPLWNWCIAFRMEAITETSTPH